VVLLRDNAKFGSKAGEPEDERVDWEVDDVGVGSSSSGETQESNRLISHATMLNEGGSQRESLMMIVSLFGGRREGQPNLA
jgi:hypothetical protein